MKFETPKMDINVFSENIVTVASGGIENKATVQAAKGILGNDQNHVDANNILTFTFD